MVIWRGGLHHHTISARDNVKNPTWSMPTARDLHPVGISPLWASLVRYNSWQLIAYHAQARAQEIHQCRNASPNSQFPQFISVWFSIWFFFSIFLIFAKSVPSEIFSASSRPQLKLIHWPFPNGPGVVALPVVIHPHQHRATTLSSPWSSS